MVTVNPIKKTTLQNSDHFNLLCHISELSTLLTGASNIENFLQRTVEMVARHLSATVCSIYLYDDKTSEIVLRATVGLNPNAIGQIRMKSGEGLVGAVMMSQQPILEGSASHSPQFKYFEAADEDRFESFLAVPIFKGIQNIGVLVVQHETRDYFDDIDIMALKAIASQLASAIENARLLMDMTSISDASPMTLIPEKLKFIKGQSACGGFAHALSACFGKSHGWLLSEDFEDRLSYTRADYHRAFQATLEQLKEFQTRFSQRLPESASLIFSAHFMMLKDPRFNAEILGRIDSGISPPRAIQSVARKYIAMFSSSPYMYLREKVSDIEDLAGRLLENLKQQDSLLPHHQWREHIVIARELYPSDILKLASQDVRGVILVSGGITSHVSILARSMKIPAVIADCPELLQLPENIEILLDADMGNIYVAPSRDVILQFENRKRIQEVAIPFSHMMSPTTFTRDGERVRLMANINLLSELPLARDLKAEGIGLYRSEFPFIIRSSFPSEEEQIFLYKRLINEMPEKDVTIRTLDIGGDKVLSYSNATGEANPELGMRSIRFSLGNPQIFEFQIRAILRAAADAKTIQIMFPMISSLDEYREARGIVTDCIHALVRSGLPHHPAPEIGMMVELPSVIEIMDELAREVDFFSIGTNDFVQYMLAVDRTNEKVARYYQPCHPSVLRGLAKIVAAANRHSKPISVCGELAHELEYIWFFIGIGIRRLSVDPQFLPRVQLIVNNMNATVATLYADELLTQSTLKDAKKIVDGLRNQMDVRENRLTD